MMRQQAAISDRYDIIEFKGLQILQGKVTGQIAITPLDTPAHDIDAYHLYWGSDANEPIGQCIEHFKHGS